MAADTTKLAHDVADELFDRHAGVFGGDLDTYRGHAQRVIGLVGEQVDVPAELAPQLGIAGFFHDAGIWFDGTWDYLPPSVARAEAEVADRQLDDAPLVAAMIDEHHRLRPARHADPLVEAFRRADLTDVSAGLVPAPGVARHAYRELTTTWPAGGFRPMLVRAFAKGLRQNPARPMPMMKL